MDSVAVYKKCEILRDREENSEVVVVKRVSTRADEYVVKKRDLSESRYSDQTVYQFNSRYECVQPGEPVSKESTLNRSQPTLTN